MDNNKPSILIIDDAKANILALSHILSDTYNLLAAKSGIVGIDIAIQQQPTIILLDIIMPDMDGYEVLATLQADPRTTHIPVIFISGLDSPEDEEKGLALGSVDYIIKPFNASVVKLRIATQIKNLSHMHAIENASLTDALTGLPNRAAINRHLDEVWQSSLRNKAPLSILMIDIDNFKNINDTYGHLHGDVVLKHVADIIRISLDGQNYFAGRFGGEEFIIVLPACQGDEALAISDAMLENIRNPLNVIKEKPYEHPLTVSVGIFSSEATHASSTNDFIEKADKSLYVAKRTGKDRSILYKDEYQHTLL